MACGYVVLAHKDPQHLERLIGALAPSPVFVHIDARVTGTAYSSLRQRRARRSIFRARQPGGQVGDSSRPN